MNLLRRLFVRRIRPAPPVPQPWVARELPETARDRVQAAILVELKAIRELLLRQGPTP